ncbi:phospholipase D-like domain-containing protein [Natronoglomus mannanivorans]|uniref:Phospholipase D-like domain-containing protein n=1 Tax=Natronoglomus mannanivorans TaxID=2979990 RepID=A0AAP3E2A6_9EURY|nr:phospholipase D-like domain-containing protein [Halobacteria archaeon AArc-xg1-1]
MRARLVGGLLVFTLLVGLAVPVSGGERGVGFDDLDSSPVQSTADSSARDQIPSLDPDESHDGEATCPDGPTVGARETAAELESAVERGAEADRPRIVELYPNPTTYGNVGEFVVVAVPGGALEDGNWTLTDGHTSARLPNETETESDRVAYSMAPEETEAMTTHPVGELEGHLRLAADGDELELRNGSEVVDRVAYDRAPEGERWTRASGTETNENPASGQWWPRGATCLEALTTGAEDVTAFTLPDAPEVPLETFAAADDRIVLAGYTFTSEAVADELRAAAERGVEVEVLLESGPVGGTPDRTKTVVDDLEKAGVDVRVLGGPGARYQYQHAKYAVVDDSAIVTTENWKPSGIGGTASRGWAVVVDDVDVATHLRSVFRADFEGRDTTPWADHRQTATFVEAQPVGDQFTGQIDPETVSVDSVDVLLAPDNAESELRAQLRSAEDSVLVKQVRIGSRNQPLLEETLEAARRGVEVRILLDASWYVEDENRDLVRWLERTADEEDLPLEARLVEPRNRFEKIHAKGVVVDEETAVVGSVNWNNHSLRENREVVLVLHGDEVGSFYADVFEADWEGGSWSLPVGLLVVLVLALAAAGLVGRRYVRFDGDGEDGDRWTMSLEAERVGFDVRDGPDLETDAGGELTVVETGSMEAIESERRTGLEVDSDSEFEIETETETESESDFEFVSTEELVSQSRSECESESGSHTETETESKTD